MGKMEERTNIRLVMDNIMIHPLLRDLSIDTVIRYTVDFMRIVGCPYIFAEKNAIVKIRDYRGELPCDFFQLNQMRTEDGRYYECATATFHNVDHDASGRATYKIQGRVLISSLEKDDAEINYQAIDVDEDGFPTIPDNSKFIRALEAYIKMQWFTVLFDTGRVSAGVLENAQKDYSWYVGQCCTEQNKMSIDKLESLSNQLTSLMSVNHHKRGFKNLGAKEEWKKH